MRGAHDRLARIRIVVDAAHASAYPCPVNALGQRTSVTPSRSGVNVRSPINWGYGRTGSVSEYPDLPGDTADGFQWDSFRNLTADAYGNPDIFPCHFTTKPQDLLQNHSRPDEANHCLSRLGSRDEEPDRESNGGLAES